MAKRQKELHNMNPNKRRFTKEKRGELDTIYGHRQPNSPAYDQTRKELDEAMRRSPALAVAQDILTNFSRPPPEKEGEQPSLADLFIAATYQEAARYSGKLKKAVQDVMMQYRVEMQKAHRFVLDDEFVEYATIMSSVPAEKVLARLQFATLPYEQTWIEFNLRAKVRTLRQIHKVNDPDLSDISPRLGMLMQRINDTDAVITLISEIDDKATPHMTCYFYSTVERDFVIANRSHYGCVPMSVYETNDVTDKAGVFDVSVPIESDFVKRATQDNYGKSTLWGFTHDHPGMLPLNRTESDQLLTPRFLLRHGDSGHSRAYEGFKDLFLSRGAGEKLAQLILGELREFTGHMRWVVTLLAMLNEVPVRADYVVPQHQMRVGTFKKRQYMDYHRVTLKLPKTRPIPFVERHLSGAERRHRAHEVRAHWRTYLHENHCRREEHEWEYDEENGYRLCGKCMAFSRLIHEHVRGDPSLGWARKDYLVKKDPAVN